MLYRPISDRLLEPPGSQIPDLISIKNCDITCQRYDLCLLNAALLNIPALDITQYILSDYKTPHQPTLFIAHDCHINQSVTTSQNPAEVVLCIKQGLLYKWVRM